MKKENLAWGGLLRGLGVLVAVFAIGGLILTISTSQVESASATACEKLTDLAHAHLSFY